MVKRARINIISFRGVSSERFRAHGYEFEDQILNFDAAHLSQITKVTRSSNLVTDLKKGFQRYSPSFSRFLGKDFLIDKLKSKSDMLFVYFITPGDMLLLDSIPEWKTHTGISICWVPELWLRAIENREIDFRILNSFDHVICSMKYSAVRLAEVLDVPVTYLTWGIDAIKSSPWPEVPKRVIDFNNISKVSAVTHSAIKRMAKSRGQFYMYDTALTPSIVKFADHRDHRHQFSESIKRTKFFFTPMAKRDSAERGNQVEFGTRYLEAAAGGAILVGDRPQAPSFDEHMGWHDSVIEMPHELDAVEDFFDHLMSDPVRLEKIHCRNVLECMKRHDYAYRWQKVLEIAGLESSEELNLRLELLVQETTKLEHILNQF